MSIWDIGVQHVQNQTKEIDNEIDTTLFFVGEKESGKSTLISRFLDKNDKPKSTVALEYSFGRQTRGHNIPKSICHVWELGGGTWLQKLIDVVIIPDTLKGLTLVIMVDLSQPASIFSTIESVVNCVKARINFILDKLNDNNDTRDYLTGKLEERLTNSIERELKEPMIIPLIIVGGKYDKLKEQDSKRTIIINKTMRFLSNYYAASLVYFSTQYEPNVNRLKAILRHYAFGSSLSKVVDTSANNPIIVPVGQDSFVDIGLPEFQNGAANQLPSERLTQFWKRAFYSYFQQPDPLNLSSDFADPGKNTQYAEKVVDEAKAKKDEELETFRRISDRKMRDLQQQAINDGIIVI